MGICFSSRIKTESPYHTGLIKKVSKGTGSGWCWSWIHVALDIYVYLYRDNQGNIAKWLKKEGDKIEVGDVICDIETDKATLEHECLEEGFLAKILAPEGSKDIAVRQDIAITVEDPKDSEAVKTSITGNLPVKEAKSTSQEAKTEANKLKSGFSRISLSAKLLITEHGLDASSLLASGPRGTLLKGDVLDAIKSGKGSARTSSAVKKSPPQVQPQTSSAVNFLRLTSF